jgi:hypothetical protein
LSASHLPLETIFNIPRAAPLDEDYDSKKTYRDPKRAEEVARAAKEKRESTWTAGGLMEGRAEDRGFGKSMKQTWPGQEGHDDSSTNTC